MPVDVSDWEPVSTPVTAPTPAPSASDWEPVAAQSDWEPVDAPPRLDASKITGTPVHQPSAFSSGWSSLPPSPDSEDWQFTKALTAPGTGVASRIGQGLAATGKAVGDVAKAYAFEAIGEPGLQMEQLTGKDPWEAGRKTLPTVPRAAAGAVSGLVESSPQLALAAVDPVLGGMSFGFTPEGFDPVQAGTMLLAPEGGKILGNIAAKAAVKLGVKSGEVLTAIDRAGGASGVAGLMSAPIVYQISQMPDGEAKREAIENASANALIVSIMAASGGREKQASVMTPKQAAANAKAVELSLPPGFKPKPVVITPESLAGAPTMPAATDLTPPPAAPAAQPAPIAPPPATVTPPEAPAGTPARIQTITQRFLDEIKAEMAKNQLAPAKPGEQPTSAPQPASPATVEPPKPARGPATPAGQEPQNDLTTALDYSPEDLAKYKELKQQYSDLSQSAPFSEEHMKVWQDFENLRNKYNGNQPRQIVEANKTASGSDAGAGTQQGTKAAGVTISETNPTNAGTLPEAGAGVKPAAPAQAGVEAKLVKFDDLHPTVKGDIAANLKEKVPFLRDDSTMEESDVLANLDGLVDEPVLKVSQMPVSQIEGFNRKPSKVAVKKFRGMLEKTEAPPIIVSGNKFIDGGHRLQAYIDSGRTHIPVVDIEPLLSLDWEKYTADKIQPPKATLESPSPVAPAAKEPAVQPIAPVKGRIAEESRTDSGQAESPRNSGQAAQPTKFAAGSNEQERIISPAVQGGGEIYKGENHFAIDKKEALSEDSRAGFVTSKGRFVTRYEAPAIARKSGQLDHLSPTTLAEIERRGLSSSDLAPQSFFASEPKPGKGITIDQTKRVSDAMSANFKNAPETVIHGTPDTLPDAVKGAAKAQGVNLASVKAVYHDGKVHLIASNLDNPAEAAKKWLHEAAGHQGVEAVLGDKANEFLDGVYDAYKGKPLMDDLRRRYANADKRTLAREVLAHLAENPAEDATLWQKVVAKVRATLRAAGVKLGVTEGDVQEILRRAVKQIGGTQEAHTAFAGGERSKELDELHGKYFDAKNRGDEQAMKDVRAQAFVVKIQQELDRLQSEYHDAKQRGDVEAMARIRDEAFSIKRSWNFAEISPESTSFAAGDEEKPFDPNIPKLKPVTALPFKPPQEKVSIGERDALKAVMKARQQSSEEGFEAGKEYAERDALVKQASERQAFSNKIAATQQQFAQRMGELKQSERWSAADSAKIRESLLELAKEMPMSERGRFISQITAATQRPALGSDPDIMWKRAAKVAAKMQDHTDEVWRKTLVSNIRKVVDRSLSSPSVDIRLKQIIRNQLQKLEVDPLSDRKLATLQSARDVLGKISPAKENEMSVQVPQKIVDQLSVLEKTRLSDVPADALQALWTKLASMEKVGRKFNANRIEDWNARKNELLDDVLNSPMRPMNEAEGRGATRPAGTAPTILTRLSDKAAAAVNAAANIDRAVLPVDALFDEMDGGNPAGGVNYSGVLSRRFKGAVNWNRQRELVMRDEITQKLADIRKKNNLNSTSAERIGVFALLQQKGVRDRLIDQGETPENLDHIASSMTPGEMEYYRAARGLMEQNRPQIADLMRRLYNVELKPEPNYWPLQRDWQKYAKEATPMEAAKLVESGQTGGFDELGTWNDLSPDYGGYLRTKTEQGFTKERKRGMTPVKVNAFEVLDQHFRAVTHLLAHQEDLKMMGEAARSDVMKEKAGAVGQKILLDWLDTVARDGRVDGHQRNRALDALRRMTTMGIIPWNPVTMLVHTSQIPVSMAMVGPRWMARAALALTSHEGRQFVYDNMRSIAHRSGSEPAISEVQRGGHPIMNMLFGGESMPAKAMQAYTQFGTFPIRLVDTIHSMVTALGAYQRELALKGINPDEYASHPVDAEALNRAMALSRRTVASVQPEDMPQILSRGKSFSQKSGSVSVAKTLLQFGNTYLDIWSTMRHDLTREAIPAALQRRDPKSLLWAGALGTMIAGSIMWEAGIRHTMKGAINSATGAPQKKDDTYDAELEHELLRRFPFMGNAMATRYGNSGIPVLDTITQTGEDIYRREKAKKEGAKERGNVRIAADVGTLLGVPGASLAGRLTVKSMTPAKKEK